MNKKIDSTDTYYLFVARQILRIAPVVGVIAAVIFTAARIAGIFRDVSILQLVIFDAACVSYFFVAALMKKFIVVENGEVNIKKLLTIEWVIASVVVLQWNLITYIFPARDFWGYAPMFVLLTAFMFHSRVVLGEILGISASIGISWLLLGDTVLPVKDENFIGNFTLRIVALIISFSVILLLTRFAGRFARLAKENYRSLEKQNADLENYGRDIIEFTAEMVEERDYVSGNHVKRLKKYTEIMARKVAERCPEYGLDEEKIEKITLASVLHDVGKIAIPDGILQKKDKLTAEEFEIIKTHTTLGTRIIDKLPESAGEEYRNYCREICLYHHEKYDGSGYPEGLCGDSIPIAAQIVSVVDCYDALTSKRPYKEAVSPDMAIHMILCGECGAFSDNMKACLLACRDELASAAG